jgi:hypothetical protein
VTNEQRKVQFLVELAELTRRTGVVVEGCGCCASPSLRVLTSPRDVMPVCGYGFGYANELTWLTPDDDAAWANYSPTIVKNV